MFATSIPKYYSFGSKTTLNQNYIVQEMFNSKDKDVTFRILTRALYTLNDATLKLENMNLPPSATIYLGFIEPYANIFVHVCSKGITFNYIKNPLITFSVPIVGNEPLSGYKEQSYCISLGGVKAKGKLLVFPKGSHEVIQNPDVKYNFFFKPYDQKNYFLMESPFIGHDLNVTIEIEREYEELKGHLASPLYLLYHNDNFTENSKNSFIEFSNYSTNRNSLRNHLIFIESDKLKFSYSDANYFIRKIPNFNMPIKRELRGVNMITSMMGNNSTSKNNFLFTFSVIDGVAEVEVFIVSDVVSWVKGILLREIYDDGYKVAPNCSEVNIFSTESVFAVHAQKETSEGVFDNFYFYKVEEMTITMFKVVEAKSFEIQGFKVARNIRIQQNLLYIIYEGFDYFHIMDLRTDKNTFYKKYKVDVYNKDKGILYISGKCCGTKMVIETNSGELYLFDVSDPLFPVYLMTLPVPDRLSPHTKGGNYFYNCIDDHILILPFDEISQFPSPNITMYLMVYDLRRPMHTTLMYRYKIPFEVNDFKSFIHSRFADTDYLYLFADSTVLVLKVFSGFVISFPDENIDYLKQTKGLYFNLVAKNNEQKVTQQVTQQVNLYTVQSGIVLKSGSKHIQLHAPKDFKKYYINLDDYFKGFRSQITVIPNGKYRDYNSSAFDTGDVHSNVPLNYKVTFDPSLFNLTYGMIGYNRFEISNPQFNYEMQKGLILLDQVKSLYLYVDCKYFIYFEITNEAAIMKNSSSHGINGKITKVKHIPNFYYDKNNENSYGTAIVQYLINGYEEVIQFCNIRISSDPSCVQGLNYPLGVILDYFVYSNTKKNSSDYLIVASVTSVSRYSLIRFFEDKSCKPCKRDFQYVGEISSTTLDSPRFCLDSVTIFSRFLVFSNHSSLFVLDLNDYIESPRWFTPTMVREVSLDKLMEQYSGGLYSEVMNVTHIHIEDTCLAHVTLYIFTKDNGILMLNVFKEPFKNELWKNTQVLSQQANDIGLPKDKTENLHDVKSILYSGRLLPNYYNFDFSDSLYAVNSRMMGLLIKIKYEGGYHMYIFRCFNIMTHEESIVNFDQPLSQVSECKNMFIEDEDIDDGIVTFTILCDSTIIKIDVSERTEVEVNTDHPYWTTHKSLFFNITQPPTFVNISDNLVLEVEIVKSEEITDTSPYAYGFIMITLIAIASSIGLRYLCKE